MLQTCAVPVDSIRMASFQRPFEGRSRFAQSWFLGFEALFLSSSHQLDVLSRNNRIYSRCWVWIFSLYRGRWLCWHTFFGWVEPTCSWLWVNNLLTLSQWYLCRQVRKVRQDCRMISTTCPQLWTLYSPWNEQVFGWTHALCKLFTFRISFFIQFIYVISICCIMCQRHFCSTCSQHLTPSSIAFIHTPCLMTL